MLISTHNPDTPGRSRPSFNPSTGLMLISTGDPPELIVALRMFQSLDWVDVDFDVVTCTVEELLTLVSIPRLG